MSLFDKGRHKDPDPNIRLQQMCTGRHLSHCPAAVQHVEFDSLFDSES